MTTTITNHPTLAQLRAHMEKYGPVGILESARHLSDEDQAALEQDCKRARKSPPKHAKRKLAGGKGRKR